MKNVNSFFNFKKTFIIVLLVFLLPIILEAKRVYVRGYFRKNGTYVRPHYRTWPDGNPYNNYSFPGNYNPNTGKITGGDPEKYLERYYSKKKTSIPDIKIPDISLKSKVKTLFTYNEAIQLALLILGYNVGPVDGIIGPKTRYAIICFQIDHGLKPDGIIGPRTLKALINSLENLK